MSNSFIDASTGSNIDELKSMIIMVMMMMMMNSFCGMVDHWKAFNLISIQDHCQRSSPSRISNASQARFTSVQNLTAGFVE